MKTLAKLAVVLGLGVALIAPASAADICLQTFNIRSTKVLDAKNILFTMRDGTVYRNTLRTPCIGLLFHGFAYKVNYDELCGYGQAIHVVQTHDVCVLGKFTKEPLPPAPPAHS